MKQYILLLLALIITSACKQESKQESTEVQGKTLERMYIKNKNGAILIDKPSEKGKMIDSVAYGSYFYEIYHENDLYYRVIKDQVPLFVLKDHVGIASELTLDDKDLNMIHLYIDEQKQQKFNKPKYYNDSVSVRFTDVYNYNEAKKQKVSYLKDTLQIQKTNNSLILHFQKGVVHLQDTFSEKEIQQMYHYRGYDTYLDNLVIEEYNQGKTTYMYFDAKSGDYTDYEGVVYVSPTGKKAIVTYSNPQEEYTSLAVYELNEQKQFKLKYKLLYSYWLGTNQIDDKFWSADGYFYIKIKSKFDYWNVDSTETDDFQYIIVDVNFPRATE